MLSNLNMLLSTFLNSFEDLISVTLACEYYVNDMPESTNLLCFFFNAFLDQRFAREVILIGFRGPVSALPVAMFNYL